MQLPRIELSPEEIERLEMVNSGTESIITKSNRSGTLYKIFDYDVSEDNTDTAHGIHALTNADLEKVYANKENTLNAIFNMPNLEYSVLPLSIITSEGKFRGYEMTYDSKDISLSSALICHKDQIKTLRRIQFILEYYFGRGMIYADVRSDNILINRLTRALKFCDIDNASIKSSWIDFLPNEACEFIDKKGRLDTTVSMYMYNLLVFEQLAYHGEEYQNILKSLKAGDIPSCFDSRVEQVITNMLEPHSFQGESVLPYVKRIR